MADPLLWVMAQHGVQNAIHYLDDFLIAELPDSTGCQEALSKALQTCTILGVPVAPKKLEGPASTITFLGLQFDTQLGQLRLPEDKLRRL